MCSSCGGRVCEDCIDLESWTCKRCSTQHDQPGGQHGEGVPRVRFVSLPQVLLVIGLATVVLGFVILFAAGILAGGEVSTGGVVFIGPIPIIFGSGGDPALIALVSFLALAAIIAALYLVFLRRRESEKARKVFLSAP